MSPKCTDNESDSSKKTDLATIMMFEDNNLNSSTRSNIDTKFNRARSAAKSYAVLHKQRPSTQNKIASKISESANYGYSFVLPKS